MKNIGNQTRHFVVSLFVNYALMTVMGADILDLKGRNSCAN